MKDMSVYRFCRQSLPLACGAGYEWASQYKTMHRAYQALLALEAGPVKSVQWAVWVQDKALRLMSDIACRRLALSVIRRSSLSYDSSIELYDLVKAKNDGTWKGRGYTKRVQELCDKLGGIYPQRTPEAALCLTALDRVRSHWAQILYNEVCEEGSEMPQLLKGIQNLGNIFEKETKQ